MELITVPRRLQFNAENLRLYLEREIRTFSCTRGNLVVNKFKHGESNPTYHLKTSSGQEYVLRKRPPGKLLPGAHRVDREFKVLSALYSISFPVPRPFLYCSDITVVGTDFYIMECVKGRVFRDTLLPGLSSLQRHDIYVAFISTLARLHSIDWRAIGLDHFGGKGDYSERQISVWTNNYRAAVHKGESPSPQMEHLMSWLPSNTPHGKQPSTIVHGDFRIDNVVFHPTEPRVIAVLDWELCTIGHPLSDLAFVTVFSLITTGRIVPIGESMGVTAPETPGIPNEQDLTRLYCALMKMPHPLTDLAFFKTLSCFRMASMIQGVYARGLLGNASSAETELFKAMVDPLADTGCSFIEDKAAVPSVLDFIHYSQRARDTLEKVKEFVEEHVYPVEAELILHGHNPDTMWTISPIMEELKEKARQAGLWNLFLPGVSGFKQQEYAPMAEVMGRCPNAPEVFNCSAPDTGNMEVIYLYGSEYQKKQWLEPLLNGTIRSCFSMTEPGVASSDATNMECTITRDGDSYVVTGRKWWSSGAGDPRCSFSIVMGVTNPEADRLHRHAMIIVPLDSPGITKIRPLSVFGFMDAPHGHLEIDFNKVRVPTENLILGEGRGFEIAQGRLGPGRIHHCMRLIGMSERALEMTCQRAAQRQTFGKKLFRHQTVRMSIAESRMEINQSRLLVLKAAHAIDCNGTKAAQQEIAAIKVVVAQMACRVVDRAIQVHGGMGVCQDTILPGMYAGARSLRIADGPDIVHMETVAKHELRSQLLAKL